MNLPDWMIRVTVDFMAESMFRTDYHTIRSQSLAEGKSSLNRRTDILSVSCHLPIPGYHTIL